VLGQGRLLH